MRQTNEVRQTNEEWRLRTDFSAAQQIALRKTEPPILVKTPLRRLQTECGLLWVKDETAQNTRAFKIRGALHKISLSGRPSFVVAASTGNHAICVAFAARSLGLRAVVFVPASTPSTKIDAIRAHGASIHQVEGEYEAAAEAARVFAAANRAVLVHGFDDPQVIEGHLSLFQEIEDDLRGTIDRLFVPVGGGGLLAAAIQATAASTTRVVAVEFQGAQRLKAAILDTALSSIQNLSAVPLSCEGLAIRTVGRCAVAAARTAPRLDVVAVSVREMVEAARLLWNSLGIRSELAGAAATAAALAAARAEDLGTSVAIVTGGNISDTDFATVLAGMV
jgi:threonine dehydratase